MKAERNITRMDYTRAHGWWVRFQRVGKDGVKRVTSKHFSDAVHGGKRKALAAAVAWRDRLEPRLPRSKRRNLVTVPPGYGYVKRTEMLRRADRHPVYFGWIRLEQGSCSQTSWSVTRWGELGAKLKCQQWLVRQRRELRKRIGKARPQ